MQVRKALPNAAINRNALRDFRSRGCLLCEERDHRVIESHHIDPSEKRFTVGSNGALNRDPFEYAAEIAKCAPLCPTCHRKVDLGIVKLPEEDE
jgi:hypothetical protein